MHFRSLLLFLFLISALTVQTQVFSLYDSALYDTLTKAGQIENNRYADINGTLLLKVDKQALLAEMGAFAQIGNDLSDQLSQLHFLLENELEIMSRFQAYRSDPSLGSLNALAEEMVVFEGKIRTMADMRTLYQKYNDLYFQTYTRTQIRNAGQAETANNGVPNRGEFILVQLQQYAADLAQRIAAAVDDRQVKVIFSGYIRNEKGWRPVKLSDDFDTKAEEVYNVPRWQTQLTAEDRARLERIDSLANSLNQLWDARSEDIKNWLKEAFSADDCLRSLEVALKQLPATLTSLADTVQAEFQAIIGEAVAIVEDLGKQYLSAESASSNITSIELLEGFSQQLNATVTDIEALISGIDDRLLNRLKTLPQTPEIQSLVATYTGCKKDLQKDREMILTITRRLKNLFASGSASAKFSLQLGDDLRRLSYDTVPEQSYIDLQSTGQRKNGDQMKIVATLEDSTATGTAARKVIDTRLFKLQQIGLYSVIKPMLLLANPFNGPGDNSGVMLEKKKYQFAPSYSLLFKFGSRKSKAINEIWQPAVGVNFSALDFDTEGTPEFGAAFEFTFLKDYFSMGGGYNFALGEEYVMFGFRLPIGALPLPMFNAVETNN